MSIKQSAIRVGELLQDSGIVRPEEMIEAIQVSKRLGVPIGRVLMMSGWVRADELEAALHSQVLVRTEQIPREAALSALRLVHEQHMSLIDALSVEEFEPQIEDNPALLAELLLDSNLVSPEQIELAYEKSQRSGIPLASALVLQGVLSPNLFPSLQRIQLLIENGELSREEGVLQVQNTFMLWLKAEESLNKDTFPEGAGSVRPEAPYLMSESNIESKVRNRASTDNKPETSAEPQPGSESKPPGSVESQIQTGDRHPQVSAEAASAVSNSDVRLVDLLKSAGYFTQEDIQQRYQAMLADPVESGRFFIELGLIDEHQAKVALRSHSLLTRGLLNQEEAIYALGAKGEEKDGGSSEELSPTSSAKVQRYMDKQWRGRVSRALGGAIIGALVAGLTLSSKREKK